MPAKIYSCGVNGLNCNLITVEADIISSQVASFQIVGLPDAAVQESKERVRSAIKNSDATLPWRRKVINLAPADIKKQGPSFDLPIAVCILIASEQIINEDLNNAIFIGELSLEGKLRHSNGILPIACYCREKGFKRLFLPKIDANEAGLIPGVEIYPVEDLKQLILHLRKEESISQHVRKTVVFSNLIEDETLDMKYVKGQEQAKRALEIAACGQHNILFQGSPGSGKTLLAKTFRTILPDLNLEEALEVSKIYSIAGLLPKDKPLIKRRPFRVAHHTASAVSIVGGGTHPKPGEISLAHKGVLFLDEIAEFPLSVLESLRQPLEDQTITISRAANTLTYPAHFILIGSMNPCPCGYHNDNEKDCVCSFNQIQKYQKKLSGPLLDRIDMRLTLSRVNFEKLSRNEESESSADIKARVESAKKIQLERFMDLKINSNSEMRLKEVKEFCSLNAECLDIMKNAVNTLHLSARAYFRSLKLARTIADLDSSEKIKTKHLHEALFYRGNDSDQY